MPRSVQLSDEAYATLRALKQEGESFSDVVKRLARERKNPRALLELPPLRKGFDLDKLRVISRKRELRSRSRAAKGGQ